MIEKSYLSPADNEHAYFEGELNDMRLEGRICLERVEHKQTDKSPDYDIGIQLTRNGRTKWYPAGKAWLNTAQKPGTIPGDAYLSLKFHTPRHKFNMLAIPGDDGTGAPTEVWAITPKAETVEQQLDDEVGY